MITVLLYNPLGEGEPIRSDALERFGCFEVVGEAKDPKTALELTRGLRPQVICARLDSAGTALNFTREMMREWPTPILLLDDQKQADLWAHQQFLQAGGLEVFRPLNWDEESWRRLSLRLRILAGVKVFARRRATPPLRVNKGLWSAGRVVAIGASTGGPQALAKLLHSLSGVRAWPILCVQHMSSGFMDGMISWLSTQTALPISLARHGEMPKPGQIYFAPEQAHLRVRIDGSLALETGAPVDGHRPSATVLLRSVAEVYGKAGIGILLTGMGSDGASGLLQMADAGATTMAQDEASSVVYGMAKAALELGAVTSTTSLENITQTLLAMAEERRR